MAGNVLAGNVLIWIRFRVCSDAVSFLHLVSYRLLNGQPLSVTSNYLVIIAHAWLDKAYRFGLASIYEYKCDWYILLRTLSSMRMVNLCEFMSIYIYVAWIMLVFPSFLWTDRIKMYMHIKIQCGSIVINISMSNNPWIDIKCQLTNITHSRTIYGKMTYGKGGIRKYEKYGT